jgi:hypothetical protein
MSRLLGKLAFIHRRLWQRDGWYKAATLFGPPPLIGAMLAATVWFGMTELRATSDQPIMWAKPAPVAEWKTSAHDAASVPPAGPLPATGADGMLVGYETGWRVTAHPIEISQTMDVDIKTTALAGLNVAGTSVDMSDILLGGPSGVLFVADGIGALVIRTPGIYALAARLTRPTGERADCLVRLGFANRRVVSNLEINLAATFARDFGPGYFDLQPGLYLLSWAFGCWHDREMSGTGRLTILIGHPGSEVPEPLGPDEIVRPKRAIK